jgi:hypothetical protein
MAAADAVRLVVQVPRRIVGANQELVRITRVEMKYAGLSVIDPDDRVVMALHRYPPEYASRQRE